MGRATADYIQEMKAAYEKIGSLRQEVADIHATMSKVKPNSMLAKKMALRMAAIRAEIDAAKNAMATAAKGAVGASKTAQFMKNFGGNAVPIVCLAVDVVNEALRHQEIDDEIEKGGFR